MSVYTLAQFCFYCLLAQITWEIHKDMVMKIERRRLDAVWSIIISNVNLINLNLFKFKLFRDSKLKNQFKFNFTVSNPRILMSQINLNPDFSNKTLYMYSKIMYLHLKTRKTTRMYLQKRIPNVQHSWIVFNFNIRPKTSLRVVFVPKQQ